MNKIFNVNNIRTPLFSLLNKHVMNEINDSTKTIKHYISASEANDYGQVLDPTKYVDARYRPNPIVMFQHGPPYGAKTVEEQLAYLLGNNNKIYTEQKNGVTYLVAESAFIPESKDSMSVYNLYKINFLHAWSKWFFPIGKVTFDDQNELVIYDTWGIYEYSAVYIPVDGLAIGNETCENAMHAVSTDMMKNFIYQNAMQGTVQHDFNNNGELTRQLNELKSQVNAVNPGISKEEFYTLSKELFTGFISELKPKLTEMTNSNKQVIDLMQKNKTDVEAIAEEKCLNVLKSFMGAAK